MAIHLKGHTKFPLGGEAYATVSVQNGEAQVNILMCRVLRSCLGPDQSIIVPTRFGVTLNEKQFRQLIRNVPLMVAEMSSLEGSSTDSSSEIVQIPSTSSNFNDPYNTPKHKDKTCQERALASPRHKVAKRPTVLPLKHKCRPLLKQRKSKILSKQRKFKNPWSNQRKSKMSASSDAKETEIQNE